MGLPLIFPPAGTPQFVVEGHTRSPASIYDDVPMLSGHSRKRRVYTVAPSMVQVCWVLTDAQMAAVDNWFENTLLVGNERFTAQIAKLGAPWVEYWTAQWVEPYTAEPLAGHLWRVTGTLLLTGAPGATKPATGALALEIELALTGSAVLVQTADLELEVELALDTATSLSLEIEMALDVQLFLDREDAGRIERESGGFIQRE